MADSAAFEPVRRSSDHIPVAARTNEPSADAQASRPRSAGGLLRPSQVPVPGATTWLTGFPSPAGERAHYGLKPLRPSGAPTGAAPVRARPSTVPARPVPGLLHGSGQPLTAPLREEMEARLGADFSRVRVHTDDAARASATEVGARAYACGSHLVIGDGDADKHTLAQELALATRPLQVQPELTIGELGDKYEQEADQVAAEVVRQINAPLVSGPPQAVQRQTSEDQDKLQTRPVVQCVSDGGMAASPELEKSIRQAQGSGQPLAGTIRESIEEAFGTDFSGVEVHTDVQSDQLNQAIQARAFTTGQDVFFRQGEYRPGSREGQALIAHELTHIVQQAGRMRTHLPHGQSAAQGKLNVTSDLVQRTPIGTGGHNYTASNSSVSFRADHIASDEEGAKEATRNRVSNGRGTTNTVLIETDADVKNKVLQADYDAAQQISGPVWRVPIQCPHIIVTAAHGADEILITGTQPQTTGTVWVKVFFDETNSRISITGVWGQD